MSVVTAPRPAAPWRRRTRRIALAFVALAGLCAAFVVHARRLEREAWREACAEADRLDPGWRWDGLLAARPEVPDERNAALHVLAAAKLLPLAPSHTIRPAGFDTQLALSPNHRPLSEAVARYKAYLNAAAPPLAEVR